MPEPFQDFEAPLSVELVEMRIAEVQERIERHLANARRQASKPRHRLNPARLYWNRSARKWDEFLDEAEHALSPDSPRNRGEEAPSMGARDGQETRA